PGHRAVNRKFPSLSVKVVCGAPLPVNRTATPGSGTPLESLTVPDTLPVFNCARTGAAKASSRAMIASAFVRIPISFLSPEAEERPPGDRTPAGVGLAPLGP